MAPWLRPERWLQVLEKDYLSSFIAEGGAAVKVPVCLDDAAHSETWGLVRSAAQRLGYLHAEVDSLSTRIHLVDELFFRVAEQVPWRDLCERVVLRAARICGYEEPPEPSPSLLEAFAAHNSIDKTVILIELKQRLSQDVFRNTLLIKDFRVAMLQLCLARLSGGEEGGATERVLADWLCGRNKAIGAVKPYMIFNRINRSNARLFLESLCQFLRMGGYAGLVLALEISRLGVLRNPRDESVYYSKGALLDAYEMLRQFIDGIDRLTSCLICVFTRPFFLEIDHPRGVGIYSALKFRVSDEVRDRNVANPTAALVRLAASS